ncbi:MAG: hypothetical protein RMK91_05270 [Pseudanabaenaceae cyanobacterium SKYGB_i_bin29]|nr:hypothetical protein [Pseudanabaenaceae cyanobacterium SKYG29]MDW8421258.1 hypothetical protein [Pseudanabaenaceae cyanobacterium SKYGB_i_bin29]
MKRYVAIGACVIGIGILHSLLFSGIDRSGELPNLADSGKNKSVKTNPRYSGVLFAKGEVSSIPSFNLASPPAVVEELPIPETTPEPPSFATALPPPPMPQLPPRPTVPVPAQKEELPAPTVVEKTTPPPLEAEKIRVMGAMAIGGKNYAIVSVPGGTTQYVTEGERLADNKVLVKTIEVSERPLVILEQNNAEFTHGLDQEE